MKMKLETRISDNEAENAAEHCSARYSRLALLVFSVAVPLRYFATYAQEQSAAPSSQQTSAAAHKRSRPGYARPKDDRRRTGRGDPRGYGAEREEENANLKHAAPVRWLARKIGLSVHQAHLLALCLNFAIIVVVVFWAARKFVPGMLRNRNASIQHALEEARAASQDANRRLADIENRLRQLDVEIGQMQATAEKEAQPRKSASRKPPKKIFAKWCWPPSRKLPPPPSKPAAN